MRACIWKMVGKNKMLNNFSILFRSFFGWFHVLRSYKNIISKQQLYIFLNINQYLCYVDSQHSLSFHIWFSSFSTAFVSLPERLWWSMEGVGYDAGVDDDVDDNDDAAISRF